MLHDLAKQEQKPPTHTHTPTQTHTQNVQWIKSTWCHYIQSEHTYTSNWHTQTAVW